MNTAPQGRNVAGIIPLTGKDNSFDFPWPDYMQPLREGFLAYERSVMECAYAGCDSIWIVCDDSVAPMIKNRLGDYVMSPKYFEEKDFVKKKDYHEKWIPIFYVPMAQKHKDRRDSLGWSALHGALTAFQVSSKMSRWVLPTKYFVSFPYGIYDTMFIKNYRNNIRGNKSFYLSYNGETVKNNKYLAFTFFPRDWSTIKHYVKSQCTGGSKLIPVDERWSSRHFKLDKVFGSDVLSIDKKVEIPHYYDLDSWSSLKNYYASDLMISRPTKKFIKPYKQRRVKYHE